MSAFQSIFRFCKCTTVHLCKESLDSIQVKLCTFTTMQVLTGTGAINKLIIHILYTIEPMKVEDIGIFYNLRYGISLFVAKGVH